MRLLLSLFAAAAVILTAQAAPADFSVKSIPDGKAFKLSEAKGKYVVLHFLLKTECPICMNYTRDYVAKSKNDADVTHIFLKPDTEAEIKAWSDKTIAGSDTLKLSLYRDPEAGLAKQFRIPDGYAFHNQVVHYPALIVLDPSGKEVFRYIGKDNKDRYSYEQLSAKLAELKKKQR